jgi:hypothetical protein
MAPVWAKAALQTLDRRMLAKAAWANRMVKGISPMCRRRWRALSYIQWDTVSLSFKVAQDIYRQRSNSDYSYCKNRD